MLSRVSDPTSNSVTIGLAQWLPACGEHDRNLRDALGFIDDLAARGCTLIALPELWPSGYDPTTLAKDAWAAAEPLDGPRGTLLSAAARKHRVWLFAGSVPESDGGELYNTTVVYGPDGRLRATHRKVYLYVPLGEHEVFTAGTGPTTFAVDGSELGGVETVGLSTCFDGDHPAYARQLHDSGARVVVSASAYEVAAESWWDLLYPANALANGQWWIMTNQCGGSEPNGLLGKSRVIAPDGTIVAEGRRIAGDDAGAPDLVVVTVDLTAGIRAAEADSGALWA